MILTSLLAAVYTFTATATGVEKGASVEFLFVGKGSDRDYEALFILDGSLTDFCKGLEAAGFPRGTAQDPARCRVWPVGTPLTLSPSLDEFVDRANLNPALRSNSLIYTGGTHTEKGALVAETEMPCALFALYTLAQSPILLNGIFEQGVVYNGNLAKKKFEKGFRQKFTLTWDGKTLPRELSIAFTAANVSNEFQRIKDAAEKGEVVVQAAFDDDLTVHQATAIASALSVLDSQAVKVNGAPKNSFFFRAFLPAVRWADRKQRMVQPYELHLETGKARLLVLDEDWTVEGTDPKITEREVSFENLDPQSLINTCLIYCSKEMKLAEIRPYLAKFPKSIINFYLLS